MNPDSILKKGHSGDNQCTFKKRVRFSLLDFHTYSDIGEQQQSSPGDSCSHTGSQSPSKSDTSDDPGNSGDKSKKQKRTASECGLPNGKSCSKHTRIKQSTSVSATKRMNAAIQKNSAAYVSRLEQQNFKLKEEVSQLRYLLHELTATKDVQTLNKDIQQ